MSADTPETLAFDSLRPTEHQLGPAKAGLRLGMLLGLGSGEEKNIRDKNPSGWNLQRRGEVLKVKEIEPEETRAFIFNVEGKFFFVSINSGAFEKSVDELKEDEFVVTEIDDEFANDLTIGELPVEVQNNGSVIFLYLELSKQPGGKEIVTGAQYKGGTWWSPVPDPDTGKYTPTTTAMKYDTDYLAGFYNSFMLEQKWQAQL